MSIRDNILATLAYYDVFDFPLKAEEVAARFVNFRHLNQFSDIARPLVLRCPQIQEIKKDLDQLILDGLVGRAGEYYFLFDREYLAPLRLKREKTANRKWRIARRAIWWLRFVPYVQAVFASGSLAMRNTDELSDLDVLIVVKHGRIWLARFLILAVLSILGVRRRGSDKIAPDKICPNHFITDKSLCIPFKSIYTAQTYANLVPIYCRAIELIQRFKEANQWVLDYVSQWNFNFVEVKPQQKPQQPMFGSSTSKHWSVAQSLENWLRQYQSKRIARNPHTGQPGGRVIYTDEQLEFHPSSIESGIIRKYNQKMKDLGLDQFAQEKSSLDKF